MLWWQTLQENFREELPVEDFFESYLVRPETEDDNQINKLVAHGASALTTAADKARTTNAEANFDDLLVKYLQAVVETFPDATKPWFVNTKSTKFASIDKQDHFTAPDITGGQPGAERPTKFTWTDAGLVLELKVDVDIFKAGQINTDSAESKNALMQLAKSARSLLASGRGCFVFVVAVTKTMARILRFDRSGFRTSAAFDWTQDSAVIPTFLWRLYNPNTDAATTSSAYMYGADPTVTIPTAAEKQKMYKIWQKTSSYRSADKPLSLEEATRDSRWLEALKGDRHVRCFTIGKPLFQSEGLFSRATRVDRVVLETDLIPRVYALKDAWRQVYRRPEKDYYDVIARYCKEKGHSTTGMARCLGSLELPHRTNSAAMNGQQRCRVRSLLTPVGLPLNQFPSSRHLILALRRAVEHHQIAYDAGVIHRDISEGNVLFDEETMDGFLVDWDYAEFNPNGMRNFQAWFPDRADEDKYPSNVKSLKDLTGTFPFYAIHRLEEKNTVHEAWHDLESFYWLLVWVILRYTDHTHIHGPYACQRLFDADDAAGTKRTWLLANPALNSDDSPLFKLASRLRSVVLAQNPVVVAPDHEEFYYEAHLRTSDRA
ncbi:hypothetical protein C8R46DRAFT_235554 [Mycena filopes]|nr:hypothetical protein C8R46DRAFT_235554 [Mycena filopes]